MSNTSNIQPTPRRFLPDIPVDAEVWLQTALLEMKRRLEAVAIDPDTPGQPLQLTATQVRLGALLSWTIIPKATGFRVYRNTTNAFDSATLIQEMAGLANNRYWDGSVPSAADYYYWVQGVNASWVAGPVSALIKITIV